MTSSVFFSWFSIHLSLLTGNLRGIFFSFCLLTVLRKSISHDTGLRGPKPHCSAFVTDLTLPMCEGTRTKVIDNQAPWFSSNTLIVTSGTPIPGHLVSKSLLASQAMFRRLLVLAALRGATLSRSSLLSVEPSECQHYTAKICKVFWNLIKALAILPSFFSHSFTLPPSGETTRDTIVDSNGHTT